MVDEEDVGPAESAVQQRPTNGKLQQMEQGSNSLTMLRAEMKLYRSPEIELDQEPNRDCPYDPDFTVMMSTFYEGFTHNQSQLNCSKELSKGRP